MVSDFSIRHRIEDCYAEDAFRNVGRASMPAFWRLFLMTSRNTLFYKSLFVLGVFTLTIPSVLGQVNSNTATVSLSATLSESLTVAVTPSTVTFPLVAGGTATGECSGCGDHDVGSEWESHYGYIGGIFCECDCGPCECRSSGRRHPHVRSSWSDDYGNPNYVYCVYADRSAGTGRGRFNPLHASDYRDQSRLNPNR